MEHVHNRTLDDSFVKRWLCQTVSETLPRRVKRLMYVASVLGVVIQNKAPDPSLLEPLNKELKLALNAPGLMFPIYIYGFIWKGKEDRTVELSTGKTKVTSVRIPEATDMDLWKLSAFFSRNVRSCLQYGSHELMAADVYEMLAILKLLPCKRGKCMHCAKCLRLTKGKPDLDLFKELKVDHRLLLQKEKPKSDFFKLFRQNDQTHTTIQ